MSDVSAPPTLTAEELTAWGRGIGATVERPVVLALRGELGAGKSHLARAVARGAGVEGPIPSPTYNLLLRYPDARGGEVVHVDLYRLRDPEELLELGWWELGAPGEVVLVEWPERAEEALPEPRWEIALARDPGDAGRRGVVVRRVGDPPPIPEPGP